MGLTPPQPRPRACGRARDITGWAPYRVARAGIGFVPEDRRIFADLTVWENLDVGQPRGDGSRGGLDGRARVRALPQAARAARRARAAILSGGEQQMLTIARTLMGNPELLLLDEPSEGLAPLVVDHLREQIARLKREGLTILLAEQNVGFSLDLGRPRLRAGEGPHPLRGHGADFRADPSLQHRFLAV